MKTNKNQQELERLQDTFEVLRDQMEVMEGSFEVFELDLLTEELYGGGWNNNCGCSSNQNCIKQAGFQQ